MGKTKADSKHAAGASPCGSQKGGRLAGRVWEIDFMRGLLIFLMLFEHLYFCVYEFVIRGLYTKVDAAAYVQATDPLHIFFRADETGQLVMCFPFIHLMMPVGIALFFLISGISCTFSRNNFLRAGKIFLFAYLLTFAFILYSHVTGRHVMYRFGALHCYAFSIFLYELVRKRSKWWSLSIGLAVLIVGYLLLWLSPTAPTPFLVPLGIREAGNLGELEYYPLLPYMGWVFLGGFLGKTVYKARKSLRPGLECKFTRFFQWMGLYSGQIYGVQFVLYPLAFFLIGYLGGLF